MRRLRVSLAVRPVMEDHTAARVPDATPCYGWRSSNARDVSMSHGTETCSCVILHVPFHLPKTHSHAHPGLAGPRQ